MHWSLISAMNLNYLSPAGQGDTDSDPADLRPARCSPSAAGQTVTPETGCHRKTETKPVDRLFKGVPVRGLATTLWIRPDPFICEGEIYLLVPCSHFFALYASINSYHCLKIINTESQESWEWQEKMGQHALI